MGLAKDQREFLFSSVELEYIIVKFQVNYFKLCVNTCVRVYFDMYAVVPVLYKSI